MSAFAMKKEPFEGSSMGVGGNALNLKATFVKMVAFLSCSDYFCKVNNKPTASKLQAKN